ncbi:MAG TPA: lysophospholipid acyltransferase family protein [Anaeromyxobacter sp.]|nr:lysophospholipid acyltransferase family protein [Anaeromyxobacter sp.]
MFGRAFGWLVTRLPRRLALAFFGGLGVLAYALHVRRRVVMDNLRLAFPEKGEEERRAIARAAYRRLGEMIPEFLRVPRLSSAELEEIFEYEGWDRFLEALAAGRGVIACTAHFGNFDLLAAAHNLRGVPMTIVARQLRLGIWRSTRARSGVETLYVRPGETLSAAVRALRAGRVLGYVIDQSEPNRNAIYPSFFGVPVATAATPAVLARRTGAPVFFIVSLPLPGGRHRVVVEGPLHPLDTGDWERDVLAFVQDLNDRLERWVRRHPEHWYWLHRRWKRRRAPAGAAAPGPAASPPPPPASH